VCALTGKVHRGKRSLSFEIRKLISEKAYVDHELSEKINRLTPEKVIAEISSWHSGPISVADCQVEVGEVLADARGRGSFQKVHL
jgi:hypothetical protein